MAATSHDQRGFYPFARQLFRPLSFVVGILAFVVIYRTVFARSNSSDFLRMRSAVYNVLQQRALTPMEGVHIVLPPTDETRKRIAVPFPPDSHIQSVVRHQDWWGGGGFQLLLELDDLVTRRTEQSDSQTTTAMVLLNHYFQGLEKLGLRSNGSPGIVIGEVQSAMNTWVTEPDRSLLVTGTIFFSPNSKQAIVICRVEEQLRGQ